MKKHIVIGVIVWLTLGSVTWAQNDGVALLSQLDSYSSYNDVWGYADGNGREIAIVGTFNGTSFVETTDPFNPVELLFLPRSSSSWADMRTYQNYAYIVTEGGGGVQIVDLSDLDNIQLVTTNSAFFSSAHNIAIDTGAATAYIPGANTGMPILCLANPTAPTLLTNYSTEYVHDCHAQDGWVHLSQIYAGYYQIADVSSLPSFNLLGSIVTAGDFTHNAWPNGDNTICITTDESGGGSMGIYDISDKNNPTLVGQFSESGGGLVHNVFIEGNIAHASYYTEGYVAVDISDPARPQKIGAYDTWPGPSGATDGAWGCYPYQPSGVKYVTDTDAGLHMLAFSVRIEHTPLTDTLTPGPYPVVARATTSPFGGTVSAVGLFYSLDGGQNYTMVPMTATGNPDEYTADIPGINTGTVQYYVSASDNFGPVRFPGSVASDLSFRVGPVVTHYFNDFEGATDEGWTHGTIGPQDDWQRGQPQGKSGDPGAAFSGNNVWANDLGNIGWNGAYAASTDNWLLSPAIDLSAVQGAHLRLQRWLTVEESTADQAIIEVNGVEVWRNDPTAETEDIVWQPMDIDISAVADGVAATQVRVILRSNSFDSLGGWTFDDVEIYSFDCPSAVNYGSGTAGTGGILPTLTASGGSPQLGNASFQIDGANLVGGSPGFMFIGFAQANLPFSGVNLLVSLSTPFRMFPVTSTGAAGSPGVGTVTFPTPIPNDPLGIGVEVDAQLVMLDPGGPQGFAATDGLSFVICDAP